MNGRGLILSLVLTNKCCSRIYWINRGGGGEGKRVDDLLDVLEVDAGKMLDDGQVVAQQDVAGVEVVPSHDVETRLDAHRRRQADRPRDGSDAARRPLGQIHNRPFQPQHVPLKLVQRRLPIAILLKPNFPIWKAIVKLFQIKFRPNSSWFYSISIYILHRSRMWLCSFLLSS